MKLENLEQMFATLQPDSTEFISSLSAHIARNPKLKTKFFNSTEELEKQITYYWNILCENISNTSYLKLFVKSLGSKYIDSHLIVENCQIIGDIFTNALKTYLKERYTPEIQQELFFLCLKLKKKQHQCRLATGCDWMQIFTVQIIARNFQYC